MCYFEREVSSESEVWPHILAGWSLLTHGGLVQNTAQTSWPRPPFFFLPAHTLFSAAISLRHSSPSLSSWNCICIMLFVCCCFFLSAEITDPGTEPWLRCIKESSAHSRCSWLNKSQVCCLSNASVLLNNILGIHPYVECGCSVHSEAGVRREVNEYFHSLFFPSSHLVITCKIPEVGGC